MPATSTGSFSSSSGGGPKRKSFPTPWRSCIRPQGSPRRSSPFSPAEDYRNCGGPAGAGRSLSAGTTRSSRWSGRLASGCQSRPRSATTRMTPDRATLTCGSGGQDPRPGRPGLPGRHDADRPDRARGRSQTRPGNPWQCGVEPYSHRFRHHSSHAWLDRGGAESDPMELTAGPRRRCSARYGASTRSARARRSYDRIMDGGP